MPATSNTRILRNPHRTAVPLWPLDGSPLAFHRKLAGYHPSPLRELPELAELLGVARVLVKDESERLGLPAFKMLGASWATYKALAEKTGIQDQDWKTIDQLAGLLEPHQPLTVATATDGNHGRAVARMARMLGLSAQILVPKNTVEARIDAIASEGAQVTVIDGHYDRAVQIAAGLADERTIVVSDTSWAGYQAVPRWVIDGYSTIFVELAEQLGQADTPDAICVPIGVGALAAATIRYAAGTLPHPTIIGVEPVEAACVEAALQAGHVVTIGGEFATTMAGLNCGTASEVAYPILAAGLDWNVAIADSWVDKAVSAYADIGLDVGETGAASLGGAMAVTAEDPQAAVEMGLHPQATLLLLITEGVTDPANFQRITGRPPNSS